jgi:hypothetical protein
MKAIGAEVAWGRRAVLYAAAWTDIPMNFPMESIL